MLVGLFACTRLITLVPLGLLLLPWFVKLGIRKKLLLVAAAAATAVALFAPFAIGHWHDFFFHPYNPWTLQTRQGHISDFLLFVPAALALAFCWRGSEARYLASTAAMLVLFVGVTMLHNMADSGNWDLFSSAYDITYYNCALPFAIMLAAHGKA